MPFGGAAPWLPAGALGVWYLDQVQTNAAGRKYVRNSVGPAPTIDANLVNGPRGLYKPKPAWNMQTGVTLTDYTTDSPDGLTEASQMVATGSWQIGRQITLTAGTYTFAVSVRATAAGSYPFLLSIGATNSAILTATASWQRFTVTATVGAGAANVVMKASASTAANLDICDFGLFSGSSDPIGLNGQARPDGTLYLGADAFDTVSAITSGALDGTNGGFGMIQFPANTAITQVTVIALASQTQTTNLQPPILTSYKSNADLGAYFAYTGNPLYWKLGGDQANPAMEAGDLLLNGTGYHVYAQRWDGTNMDAWIDDVRWAARARTPTLPVNVRDYAIGNDAGNKTNHKVGAVAIYNRALSNAEIRQAYAALAARAPSKQSATITVSPRVVFAEGDSETQTYLASQKPGYPPVLSSKASHTLQLSVWAIPGNALTDVQSRATTIIASIPANRSGRKWILPVWIGANDLATYAGGSGTNATVAANAYLAALTTYYDQMRTAGFYVIGVTVLPKTTAIGSGVIDTVHNARRNILNPLIAGLVGTHLDGYADLTANATLTDDNAPLTGTIYFDGVHLTSAWYDTVAGIIATAVNGAG
jgi:hypothetical protein